MDRADALDTVEAIVDSPAGRYIIRQSVAEMRRLRARNAELLAALKSACTYIEINARPRAGTSSVAYREQQRLIKKMRGAIAKVRGAMLEAD
jgi:hypothetical protein